MMLRSFKDSSCKSSIKPDLLRQQQCCDDGFFILKMVFTGFIRIRELRNSIGLLPPKESANGVRILPSAFVL